MVDPQDNINLRLELIRYLDKPKMGEFLGGLLAVIHANLGNIDTLYFDRFLPLPDGFKVEGRETVDGYLYPRILWNNDAERRRTLREFGIKHLDPISPILNTLRVSVEDRSKCAFQPKPGGKYIRTSWTKLLRRIQPFTDGKMTDKDIEILQAELSTAFLIPNLEFRVFRGEELRDVYSMTDTDGENMSCMTDHPAVDLFVSNPDKVGVVGLYDKGKLMGRALLWDTDQGNKFLDRVYPSDGGVHIRAAEEWAKSQGWWYKTEHCIRGDWEGPREMTVKLQDVEAYPYLDTFHYVKEIPSGPGGMMQVSTKDYYLGQFDSTDNYCPWEEEATIPLLNGDYATQSDNENGEVSYDEYADGYFWSSDAVFCENSQEYHYRYHDQVKPTLEGEYIHLGYPHGDWVEVTYGYHAGEWSNNWLYDEENDEYLTLTNTWRQRADVGLEFYAEEYGWDLDALLDRHEFIEREDPDEDVSGARAA